MIGVIGAGFHASTNILPAIGLAGIPVGGLATRSVERSQAALHRFGLSGTPSGSAADLLGDPQIDGVVVVAQPSDQLRLTREALAAGKHVFVDKPLGLTAAEARAVAQAADTAGRILTVGFMKRHAPIYRRLRALIESGELGTIRSFSLRFACDSTPFCANEAEFLTLAAIHMVDLVRFLFGEVTTVSAIGSGEGSHVALSVTLGFASGVAGTLDLTGLPSRSSETEGLVVTGDRGYVSTSDSAALTVHLTDAADAADARTSTAEAPTWKDLTERSTVFTPAESAMSGVGRDLYLRGFVGELESFAAAVAAVGAGGAADSSPSSPTTASPAADAFDNARTMDLCDRILASLAEHRARREGERAAAPGVDSPEVAALVPLVFGEPGAFRDEMVARILSGRKTGSTSLRAIWELSGVPVPAVGERRALIGSAGQPVAVVEFTEVVETTLDDITLELASHESPTIEAWRDAHVSWFTTLAPAIRAQLDDPTWAPATPGPVLATVFRVL